MKKLLRYQDFGADWLAERTSAYLGDEMRLGKTIQSITAADRLGARRILVVCPAIAKIGWAREFAEWGRMNRSVQIVEGGGFRVDPKVDVTIVNYDLTIRKAIAMQLVALKFDVIIADEAHRLQGHQSTRTSVLLRPGGLMSRGTHKWFLSGTFIGSRPAEFYPVVRAAAPEVLGPYMDWKDYSRHFCGGDGRGASNLEELGKRIRPFYLRRTQAMVWDQLPKVRQQIMSVSPDPETRRLLLKEIELHELGSGDTGEEHIAVVRRELGMKKVNVAYGHIQDLLENTKKIVVFAYHKDVMRQLYEKMKWLNPVVVAGGTTTKGKQAAMDKFRTDPTCRVFLGQFLSAGEAIDLSVSDTVVFVEEAWVPREMDQAMARVQGLNQKSHSILVQHLVFKDSLDEHMIQSRLEKAFRIERIDNSATLSIQELIG